MGNRQKLQQAGVKALADDIANFDANTIEYVGHALIQLIEEESLIHRGVNRDGKPVGYTVDTFSSERKVVGEYSTEAGYFEDPYKKIQNDVRHAVGLAPECNRLYLISNQECRNVDWATVTKKVADLFNKGGKFELYDRDRLAREIYDHAITKNSLVEFFADFLPSLWKIWTDNAISHSAPPVPQDYVEDEQRTELIEKQIESHSVVACYGISGVGKTYFATTYLHRKRDEYRNTIWVAGKELDGIASLTSVSVARLGVEVNLASHLSASPCLLVVDDFKGDASILANLLPRRLHSGTKVLVTCIGRPSEQIASIELPFLSNPAAERVLTLGVDCKPTSEQIKAICGKAGNHPLTLAIIRDTIRETETSWEAIVDDLENLPNYEGSDQQTILHRILLRHSDGVANELRSLKFLNTAALDGLLALSLLGPNGFAKLLRRSIVHKDSRGMCRMHDLVFTCLQHYEGGSISKSEVEAKIKKFLISESQTGSYHFQRSLQIHSDLIESWVDQENPEPSEDTYLFQLTERIPKSAQFLERLRLRSIRECIPSRIACMSIVEAIEQRYWREPDDVVQQRLLADGIESLTSALSAVGDSELKTDLLHHRGKLLLWSGGVDLACEDFEKVLGRDAHAFQAHLQLARIKSDARNPDCITHVELILDAFSKAHDSVGITIVLAAFSELAKKPYQGIRHKYLTSGAGLLSDAIYLAVAEGFSQPYRALGQIGRYVFYQCPDEVIGMAEHVSFPPPETANADECFDIAELMKSIGKAFAEREKDCPESEFWFNRALDYYERMTKRWEFNLTMKAECLIRLRRFSDALVELEECRSTKSSAHWWHRCAQALVGIKDADGALTSINEALLRNDDERYSSAFLQLKSQIEASKGLPCAVETLGEAIEKATNEKFKSALQLELIELSKKFD
jgi:tetratricopeptide (TPR) repeat protein